MDVFVEPYRKIVINPKPLAERTSYHKYWGALGDFLYFLAFTRFLHEEEHDCRRVLAADIYARYAGNPLIELCVASGLIDEVWVHPRKGGGSTLYPPEFHEQAKTPDPNNTLYRPGIYYDHLEGPGVTDYPLAVMRVITRTRDRKIVDIPDRDIVMQSFPALQDGYIVVHPFTHGKNRRNMLPEELLNKIPSFGRQAVVLRFYSDRQSRYNYIPLERNPGYTVLDITSPVHALWIIKHAKLLVGIESSQLMAAVIQNVHSIFYRYGGLSHFSRDLGTEEFEHEVTFDTPIEEVLAHVRLYLVE